MRKYPIHRLSLTGIVERDKYIQELHTKGFLGIQIAKIVRVSPSTVTKVLRESKEKGMEVEKCIPTI